MKNILVTGGLGHIGSCLIRKIDSNHRVTVVDDMSTQRYCSLFNMQRNITFLEKNFTDLSIDEISKFDVVVHLAAKTDAAGSMREKDLTFDVNVTKTKKFIDLCQESKIKNFIFPSSTSVYGMGQEVMYEGDDNLLPQSPYAESKILIEDHLKSSDVNYLIFRFGTIFGTSEGMRFHTAINKFCYQACLGKDLTVWKENYEQHRPYLGINDAVKAVSMAIEGILPLREVYNVVTENFKLSEIVKIIDKKIETKVNFVDTPLLNQHTYFVNFDKIKAFGFYPKDSLEDEIEKTVHLLKNIRG